MLPYAESFFVAFLCYTVPVSLVGTPLWLFCFLPSGELEDANITGFRDRSPLGYELLVSWVTVPACAANLGEIGAGHSRCSITVLAYRVFSN